MALLWLLLGAAMVVGTSLFYAQNPQQLNIFLFGYVFSGVPLWLLISVPAAVGLLLGMLMMSPGRVRAAWAARRLSSQIGEQEKTIAKLNERVVVLERDLAIAQHAPRSMVTETVREPAMPGIPDDRGELITRGQTQLKAA